MGANISSTQRKKEKLKWILLLFFAAIMFGPFLYYQPLTLLDWHGHWVVSCIGFVLAAWIIFPSKLPRGIAGILMMGLLIIGKLPYEEVFSGFTSSAIWILIPAFLFGYSIQTTGLGRRITVLILNRFNKNIASIAFAFFIIGTIFSMLTPSMTIRTTIMMPIILNVINRLNLKKQSNEAAFIALFAFMSITVPGNGWLTGSLAGPINMGLLDADLRVGIDWFTYTRALIVPWAIITFILSLYLFIIFRPFRFKDVLKYEKETLPGFSRQELFCAFIIGTGFLGYLTTPLHGLDSVTITVFVLFLLFISGVLSVKALHEGINWDIVLFIGSALTISAALDSVNFTTLLLNNLEPLIISVVDNLPFFLFLALSLVLLIRFVDVAFGLPTVALLMIFAPSLAQFGIHPLILCKISGILQAFTFFHYMSPLALISDNILGKSGWKEKHLVLYGVGFLIAAFSSIPFSIWYWKIIGII